MRLTIAAARALTERVMVAIGHSSEDAAIISDHLIDCELRGLSFGGLPRAVSISERIEAHGDKRRPIIIERETPVSALLDGGDHIGYVVAHRAMMLAIAKARQQGIAVVGANNTWYTGMLSYYAEMATRQDLVSMIASNAAPWVAPYGATQARFGTNPICFGFPAGGDPVIWDIGTSAIMHGEILLNRRLGRELPEGAAFGPDGRPTRDPDAALQGAIAVWGGHRGSGLGLTVQILGALCNSPMLPKGLGEFGCLFVVMRPDLMMSTAAFKANVAAYAAAVRAARPVAGGPPVRVPFERSAADRRRRLAAGVIEVADPVHAKLLEIAGG
jgi:delta1-piperideine-2-carboxylate reductase